MTQGASTTPWETTLLTNCMEDRPFRRADKKLMLLLLTLEATTCALQYEGSSTIYVADKELASRLDNRKVRWGSVKDPAFRALRKVFRLVHTRIPYKHLDAVSRVTLDQDQDVVHKESWLAEQVAAAREMDDAH